MGRTAPGLRTHPCGPPCQTQHHSRSKGKHGRQASQLFQARSKLWQTGLSQGPGRASTAQDLVPRGTLVPQVPRKKGSKTERGPHGQGWPACRRWAHAVSLAPTSTQLALLHQSQAPHHTVLTAGQRCGPPGQSQGGPGRSGTLRPWHTPRVPRTLCVWSCAVWSPRAQHEQSDCPLPTPG